MLAQHGPPLVNVTWTLTYEMFFYLIFVVAIINLRAGMAVLVTWQVSAAVLAISGIKIGLSGYYLRAICLEFSLGLACAWWLIRIPPTMRQWGHWALLCATRSSNCWA